MSKKLKLKIVTPERLILEEMVDYVVVPTTEGEITILPEHIPLVAGLKSGDIVAYKDSEAIPMAVVGGFIEIKKTPASSQGSGDATEVAVLADFAEHVADMTDEAIAKAKARSEELAKEMEHKDHVDFEHFATELERSLTRVKIADKWKTKKYRR